MPFPYVFPFYFYITICPKLRLRSLLNDDMGKIASALGASMGLRSFLNDDMGRIKSLLNDDMGPMGSWMASTISLKGAI